jgi:4,5-DOPA dioxygenase extradiol
VTTTLPALFVSHGAPTLLLEPVPARDFLVSLSGHLERPRAILAISAHWDTAAPTVSATLAPDTIHDFYGFPRELYDVRYAAPGAPELAARVTALLADAGLEAKLDRGRGLDHGAWVPLVLAFAQADIPVAQLSIQAHAGPRHHFELGRALRPLREERVLVLGSGGLTHNLGEFAGHGLEAPAPDWVEAFRQWVAQVIERRADEDLIEYRSRAPHAVRNHPTEDHFVPLFAALGAGTPGRSGTRIHASTTYGVLAMDAYRFD